MKHPDNTPCAGDTCAWKGDGGHISLPDDVVRTITIDDPNSKAYFAGVAAGMDVTVPEGNHPERLAYYWLAVGLAAEDRDEVTEATLEYYVLGASTQSPHPNTEALEKALEKCADTSDESSDYEVGCLEDALREALVLAGQEGLR